MDTQSEELIIGTYEHDDLLIQECLLNRTPSYKVIIPEIPTVVLGKGSRPDQELNIDECLRDRVPVVRRPGGGCSVVIDPGNVIISVVLPVEGITNNQWFFNELSMWLISILVNIGVEGIYQAGISDLMLIDRKIGGSSIHRTQSYLYYSTTLLVTPEIELMERYLKHPPREPDHRNGRSHRDFVGSLSDFGIGATPYEFAEQIRSRINIDQLETFVNQ